MGSSAYGGVLDRDNLIVLVQGETETVPLGGCCRTGRIVGSGIGATDIGVKDNRRERRNELTLTMGLLLKR